LDSYANANNNLIRKNFARKKSFNENEASNGSLIKNKENSFANRYRMTNNSTKKLTITTKGKLIKKFI